MSIYLHTKNHLHQLQQAMQAMDLWQSIPPNQDAFASTEPFAIDTMSATEWLQWIFIPRMHALIESRGTLPNQIAISPYLEEALKEAENIELSRLLMPIIEIEQLLQHQSC